MGDIAPLPGSHGGCRLTLLPIEDVVTLICFLCFSGVWRLRSASVTVGGADPLFVFRRGHRLIYVPAEDVAGLVSLLFQPSVDLSDPVRTLILVGI